MRGIETPVRNVRRRIFKEIAKFGYEQKNLQDLEDLPYEIVPGEVAKYRDSIYRERAIVGERLRLAMGMSLNPADKPTRITKGIDESNISEKYYEPPLLQVIPSACNECKEKAFIVGEQCQGCMAHPCMEVCPKKAISFKDGYSYIDQEKCIKCGQCKKVCPYGAIYERRRPCANACGVGAIETDYAGRAKINPDKCVSCGMCMVNCPFGAIADKSQIYQLIKAMNEGSEVIAILAPAFVGQFGPKATPNKIKAALLDIGFADVWEVAVGADAGALEEAKHYVHSVVTGKLPFLLTSCCPSWSMLGKKYFPEVIDEISNALTPMVATARAARIASPNAKIVFVGPCVAKKLEASRRTVRSEVDFVITFEELAGMFDAKEIDFNTYDKEEELNDVEFNVILVDNNYIHELNKNYRKIDRETDVITFALEDNEEVNEEEHRLLGDIYISVDKAKSQALEYGHSFKREICFLAVHGFLHLLGYDHMNKHDEEIMFSKQELILNEANITK